MEGQHFIFFFFFQAEDGIRDVAVTGVQTCALPISRALDGALGPAWDGQDDAGARGGPRDQGALRDAERGAERRCRVARSEERRVGKECGSELTRYRFNCK